MNHKYDLCTFCAWATADQSADSPCNGCKPSLIGNHLPSHYTMCWPRPAVYDQPKPTTQPALVAQVPDGEAESAPFIISGQTMEDLAKWFANDVLPAEGEVLEIVVTKTGYTPRGPNQHFLIELALRVKPSQSQPRDDSACWR